MIKALLKGGGLYVEGFCKKLPEVNGSLYMICKDATLVVNIRNITECSVQKESDDTPYKITKYNFSTENSEYILTIDESYK